MSLSEIHLVLTAAGGAAGILLLALVAVAPSGWTGRPAPERDRRTRTGHRPS